MAAQPSGPEAGGGVAGSSGSALAGALNDPTNPPKIQAIDVIPMPGSIESIPTHAPGGSALSVERARQLTDQIRVDSQGVRAMLLRAHEGSAHLALGYANFAEYCAAEFRIERGRAYQLLDAARVAEAAQSTLVDCKGPLLTERVARELKPLLSDPEKLREVYAEASENSRDVSGIPKPPTAAAVRQVVQGRLAPRASETASPKTALTLLDAVKDISICASTGGSRDAVHAACEAALKIFSRRVKGTGTENLGECVKRLLDAVATLTQGAQ